MSQKRSYRKFKEDLMFLLLVDKCMKWSHASYGGIRYQKGSPLYANWLYFKALWRFLLCVVLYFYTWMLNNITKYGSLNIWSKCKTNADRKIIMIVKRSTFYLKMVLLRLILVDPCGWSLPSFTWRWCLCGWSFVFGFNVIVQDWVREREGAIISLALISATVSL